MATHRHILFFCLLFALQSAGCSYGIRRPGASLLGSKEGIHKIYVAPFTNQTLKPGVENIVFNQVSRVLTSSAQVQIVSSEADADAVLVGNIESAKYIGASGAPVKNLLPLGLGKGNIIENRNVATQYSADLAASFNLRRRIAISMTQGPGEVWQGSFSRAKGFQGNNQLGVFGSTNALTNDSSFDRSLVEMAESMAYDLQESLFSQF